ncbi:putative receptor-like protein kinase At3g47110 [Rosa chinensis]|uniref:putative receptor-like protein kinase At3g47110 n=1 Tax=Rosa chinensis TaxID=74649 RepID=UPI000D08B437|nr:putative receptor-like protein kinase At3g47110 [Rosa chinensis]
MVVGNKADFNSPRLISLDIEVEKCQVIDHNVVNGEDYLNKGIKHVDMIVGKKADLEKPVKVKLISVTDQTSKHGDNDSSAPIQAEKKTGLESTTLPNFGNESDRLALLDFKKRITEDPLHIMSSWNESMHFCSWIGTRRVVTLNLQAQKLAGSVPPSIGNLTYLTGINLINNNFYSAVPQEMGSLLRLQYLNMSQISFGGTILTNISRCTQLTMIDVFSNKLIRPIPDQLSLLLKLTVLLIGRNNLTGTIPRWIGNFSSLFALSLGENNLHGSIPNELGRPTALQRFILTSNNPSGMIPSSIYNISSIYYFTVTQNQLHGEPPQNIGITLPNLEVFAGGVKKFTGTVPASLSNASRLRILDFAQNGLTGKLPAENLGRLKWLIRVNFDMNRLGISAAITLEENYQPASIANLSTQLKILTLGENLIHGSLPTGIGNLVNLTLLGMEGYHISNSFPDAIGKLHKLEGLDLNLNRFSGPIPSSLGNLTSVTRLFMDANRFQGCIPPSLGNCQNLLILNLSSNNLNGTIPREVVAIKSLSISLTVSNNSLTGSLPSPTRKLVFYDAQITACISCAP